MKLLTDKEERKFNRKFIMTNTAYFAVVYTLTIFLLEVIYDYVRDLSLDWDINYGFIWASLFTFIAFSSYTSRHGFLVRKRPAVLEEMDFYQPALYGFIMSKRGYFSMKDNELYFVKNKAEKYSVENFEIYHDKEEHFDYIKVNDTKYAVPDGKVIKEMIERTKA